MAACTRHADHHQHHHDHGAAPGETLLKDPVCGMQVNPATSRHHTTWAGEEYHFCSAGCRAKFEADPAKYLEPRPQAPQRTDAIYTCPMHPEVRQVGPGSCPICGMALEPADVTAEAPPNPELADMTRRFWIGLVLAIPVFVLEMAGHAGFHLLAGRAAVWVQAVLATPVVLWAGLPFFQRGWASVRRRSLNMFSLIALGTGIAWTYSIAATLFPGAFPAAFRGPDGVVPVYFEASAVIIVLVLLGQVLELRAREQTGGAIRALLGLAPKTARRLRDGEEEVIPLEDVHPGDRLRIRPGDGVPVDGVVLKGSSVVDESMITGESMPVAKQPGSKVTGGTVNGAGALVMRAEKIGAETMLARIVAMVAEAQRSRAPIQRMADIVSAWFVPAVVVVAVLAFIGWAIWGPPPAFGYALITAVSVLIIACPCALGLATPMSIMVGVGKGATGGVLIRSAEALERMEKVDTLVVDKTGTLTEGRPRVVRMVPAEGFAETQMLALAAALEASSEHPLGAAILDAAKEKGLKPQDARGFRTLTGKGVTGEVDGRQVAIGSARLMQELGVAPGDQERDDFGRTRHHDSPSPPRGGGEGRDEVGKPLHVPPLESPTSPNLSAPGGGEEQRVAGSVSTHLDLARRAEELRRDGATVLFLAAEGRPAGVIAIADPVKQSTPAALETLRADKVRIVMLTGDNRTTAEAVARKLGINEVEADVLPEDKHRIVRQLRAEGHVVAMAGDGVNDAPALAEADVGIAMGTGTEVAMQSAGVTLVKGDLAGIARAVVLSRAVMRNIRQNLVLAFVYNAAGIPIAAGVLYPAFGILLSPVIAAAAMAASSVSVIGNALRLRAVRL